MAAVAAPRNVETFINYFPEEGGTTAYVSGSPEFFNRKFTSTPVRIENIRGNIEDYSLEKHGFEYVRHQTAHKDFTDEAEIRGAYYAETEELIKRITGASVVKGFSHEVRRVDGKTVFEDIEEDKIEKANGAPPAMYAHIDNGPDWAKAIFHRLFGPEEVRRLKNCRYAIINAWRPVKQITRNPLAVCDAASVVDEDLVPVYAQLTPTWGNPVQDFTDQRAQVLNVRANPNHRWYFASNMSPDEVLLITIFDTTPTAAGHARRVVHSAFPYASGKDLAPRESIEFRTMVVWEGQ